MMVQVMVKGEGAGGGGGVAGWRVEVKVEASVGDRGGGGGGGEGGGEGGGGGGGGGGGESAGFFEKALTSSFLPDPDSSRARVAHAHASQPGQTPKNAHGGRACSRARPDPQVVACACANFTVLSGH